MNLSDPTSKFPFHSGYFGLVTYAIPLGAMDGTQ